MKHLAFLLTVVFLFAAGDVQAQKSTLNLSQSHSSSAVVNQDNRYNYAKIYQGAANMTLTLDQAGSNNSLNYTGYSQNATAAVVQNGHSNRLTVYGGFSSLTGQKRYDSKTEETSSAARQEGSSNSATFRTGSREGNATAYLSQTGSSNSTSVGVGSNSSIRVTQEGSGNQADVTRGTERYYYRCSYYRTCWNYRDADATSANVSVNQSGDYNSLSVSGLASNYNARSTIQVNQYESSSESRNSVSARLNNHTGTYLDVYQNGGANSIGLTVNGLNNRLDLDQYGGSNSAKITLNGANNNITLYQRGGSTLTLVQ